jgi:hypothetical protein
LALDCDSVRDPVRSVSVLFGRGCEFSAVETLGELE